MSLQLAWEICSFRRICIFSGCCCTGFFFFSLTCPHICRSNTGHFFKKEATNDYSHLWCKIL